jgi:hypothetical protein
VEELVWNARFVDILQSTPDGDVTIDYSHFDEVVPADKNEAGTAPGDGAVLARKDSIAAPSAPADVPAKGKSA